MTAQTVREKIQAHITGELPINWGVLMTLGVLMVVLGVGSRLIINFLFE